MNKLGVLVILLLLLLVWKHDRFEGEEIRTETDVAGNER